MFNLISQNVMNLTGEEKERFFKMIDENADILVKIVPSAPLLQYIINGNDMGAGNNIIFQAYNAWKNNR